MKLRLTQLILENFKSFLGTHPFVLAGDGPGLYFIRGINADEPRLGSNGAGKSTIWDALCWCLYGRSVGGLRNPDVRPWFGNGQTVVTLEFWEDEHGECHKIVRKAGPNALELDGRTISQEQIDEVIGLPYAVFTNTVLLGQGQPLFFDRAPQAKMELFSEVLGLERWEQRSEGAAQEVNALELERSTLAGETTAKYAQHEQLTTQLEDLRTRSKEWEEERSKKRATTATRLKELDKEIEITRKSAASANLAYDSASTELRALDREADKWEEKVRELTQEHEAFKAGQQAAGRRAAELERELRELGKGATCPTCGQSLKGTKLEKHRKELKAKIDALDREGMSEPPPKLVKALAELDKGLKRWEGDRKKFRDKANNARDTLDSLNATLQTLQATAAAARSTMQEGEGVANPFAGQINVCRRAARALQDDLDYLAERAAWLDRKIERTRFWIKGFKDVRLFVIDDVLRELEIATATLLDELGLEDWSIQYTVERETKKGTIIQGLNVLILAPDLDKAVKWESWSGGEAQRLKLVGSLALAEVLLEHAGVTTDLEILDEPSRGMSTEGVYDLCDCLAERAHQHGKQIYYTDHRVMRDAAFTKVITVRKTGDGSMFYHG